MCTLEEIVELDMEIVDSKQFEEMFERSISSKTPYTEESNMSSKTPYSDVTQVSADILSHSARECTAFYFEINPPAKQIIFASNFNFICRPKSIR